MSSFRYELRAPEPVRHSTSRQCATADNCTRIVPENSFQKSVACEKPWLQDIAWLTAKLKQDVASPVGGHNGKSTEARPSSGLICRANQPHQSVPSVSIHTVDGRHRTRSTKPPYTPSTDDAGHALRSRKSIPDKLSTAAHRQTAKPPTPRTTSPDAPTGLSTGDWPWSSFFPSLFLHAYM